VRKLKRRKTWKAKHACTQKNYFGSRFGGERAFLRGEKPARCGKCGNDLQLILQLHSDALPKTTTSRLRIEGLFQFYVCDDLDCTIFGFDPPDTSGDPRILMRVIPKKQVTELVKLAPSKRNADGGETFLGPAPHVDIAGWIFRYDYPASPYEEREEAEDSLTYPITQDKLGGYPFWVQDSRRPKCRLCKSKKQMTHFFQLDAEGPNLQEFWGTMGHVNLFRCRLHANEFAVNWQCT
jgi:hypothetical protein